MHTPTPRTTTTVTLLEPDPTQRGFERRVSVRYLCDETTRCRLRDVPKVESRWAQIRDLSDTGVGLCLCAELEVGWQLNVEFHRPGAARRSHPAWVVHATRQEDGTWLVGCRFEVPLTPEELLSLV